MKKGYIKIIIGGVIVAIVLALSLPSKNSKEQNVASGSFSLKEVENVFDSGDLLKARNLYQEAGEKTGDFKKLKKIQERLEEINIKLIFSSIIDEYSTNYIVKYGDALERIAKKFGTTVNLIKKQIIYLRI